MNQGHESQTIQATGHCLCGKVEVTAENIHPQVHACHCNMCRRWGGGPSMSVHCGTEVSFSDPESITVYRSCDWAELGFCKHCGSHLFYRAIETGDYILHPGSFDSSERFELQQQLFIEEKPAFYDFANRTENLTGAQVFAMHASGEE